MTYVIDVDCPCFLVISSQFQGEGFRYAKWSPRRNRVIRVLIKHRACLGHDSVKNLQPKLLMDDRPLHLVGISKEIVRPGVPVVSVGLDEVVQLHVGIGDAT